MKKKWFPALCFLLSCFPVATLLAGPVEEQRCQAVASDSTPPGEGVSFHPLPGAR